MKRLLTIFFILMGFVASAQTWPPGYTGINSRYDWLAGKFRALHVPSGDSARLASGQYTASGGLYLDTVNTAGSPSGLYYYLSGSWYQVGTGAVDTFLLATRYTVDSALLTIPTVNVDLVNASTYTGLLGAGNELSSNFFGQNAGAGATNADQSNFFGNFAGEGATNADNSNFFGNAGSGATGANASNFFGELAGYAAIDAHTSNFFGIHAGQSAANANSSNFFGANAGNEAINAAFSNFIGYQAGYEASAGAINSIFIGTNAGNEFGLSSGQTNNGANDYSVLIGRNIRTGGFKNSILLGGTTDGSYIANTANNQLLVSPNITNYRLSNFTYTLGAGLDTLATLEDIRTGTTGLVSASEGVTQSGIDFRLGQTIAESGSPGTISVPREILFGSGANFRFKNASANSYTQFSEDGSIQIKAKGEPAFDISSRTLGAALPIAYFRTSVTNQPTILDVIPNGTGGSGFSQVDVTNTDVSVSNGAVAAARVGIRNGTVAVYGSYHYNGHAAIPVEMHIGESATITKWNTDRQIDQNTHLMWTTFDRTGAVENRITNTTANNGYGILTVGRSVTTGNYGYLKYTNDGYSGGTAYETTKQLSLLADTIATGGLALGTRASAPIKIIVADAEKARYETDGRLGIGTSSPAASAKLDLTSTTQGFLPPRMNTTQQNAISSPATGLMIYNTDSALYRYYTGSAWASMASGSGGGGGGGNVSNTGTPVDNQLAIWTNSTTIEGSSFVQSNGTNFSIGGASTVSTAPLDVLTSSTGSFVVGGELSAATRTNNTNKFGTIAVPPYATAQLPFSLMRASVTSTSNTLNIGAGITSGANSATAIDIYTAANNTTPSGTRRVMISNTKFQINDQAANYDMQFSGQADANTLYVDASDDAVGIGTASPTAWLHLKAGTTAQPPLKLTSGTNLTTAEAGSMEFNGTDFFLSPSTTRKKIPLVNNSTASNGFLPIGNGTDFTLAALASSGSTITVTNGSGTINLDVSSSVATLTGTQTLTNKTLGSTIDVSASITFADGVKQTFNPNGTNSGINVGAHTANPSSPANGDLVYQSTANELRAYINGSWVALGSGGGSGANTALSNIASVAIPVSLISDANNTDDLGSSSLAWKDIYAYSLILKGSSSGSATILTQSAAGTPTLTLPTTSGNLLTSFNVSESGGVSAPAPNGASRINNYDLSGLSTNATFAAPSGTALDFNIIYMRIQDNGTSRTLSWNAIYDEGSDIPLPTATIAGEGIRLKIMYNGNTSKWELVERSGGY